MSKGELIYEPWWRHKIIENDTELIIEGLSLSQRILYGLFLILFGVFLFLAGFFDNSGTGWRYFFILLIRLFSVLFGVGIFLAGGDMLLVSEKVTLDKKCQSVFITKKSIIKRLNALKEIPFSNIRIIEISRWSSAESSDSWNINLITTIGGSERIYDSDYASDAEVIAEKIHKITDKEISHIVI